jgi:arginine decarboxylase
MRNGGGLQRLPPGEKDPPVIAELAGILDGLTEKNYREYFHDGIERREEMFNLFDLGYLSLEDRARGEELFWEICRKALRFGEKVKNTPEEFEGVRRQLASRFICNFSVFQTLPDAFSLDQLFPIMPIHRLREEPTVRAILGDITCDSDGVIDSFVDPVRSKEFLDLHPMDSGAYYVGVFLTGAYQDVMGDLHNMFGMTNEVHVVVGDEGSYTFHRVVQGDTVLDVLGYLRFDAEQLTGNFFARVNEAVGDGRIKRGAAAKIFEEWTKGIETYTYLNG